MAAYKDKNNKWYVSVYYNKWNGERSRKVKRGFDTKREALEWERQFLCQTTGDLDMTFETFVECYKADIKQRLKENTWSIKINVIETKILPYFRSKQMKEIKSTDVIAWQNELMEYRDENGKPYAPSYLKAMHKHLSAIFSHAVKYYELKTNPASKAGCMGKDNTHEMLFWTKAEYLRFSEALRDKPSSHCAFEMLYWCGLRLGELMALTPADFDFDRRTVRISKSLQHLNGRDLVTDPKTKKSIRTVQMPDFLADEMNGYIGSIYGIDDSQRIFPFSRTWIRRELD